MYKGKNLWKYLKCFPLDISVLLVGENVEMARAEKKIQSGHVRLTDRPKMSEMTTVKDVLIDWKAQMPAFFAKYH